MAVKDGLSWDLFRDLDSDHKIFHGGKHSSHAVQLLSKEKFAMRQFRNFIGFPKLFYFLWQND